VGENLQRLRERARLTQHELARLLLNRGVPWTRSKIAAVEAGERPNLSFTDVLVLANTFNVEVAELVAGDGDTALSPHVALPRAAVRDLVRGLSVLGGADAWDSERRHELSRLASMRADGDVRKTAQFRASEADQALASRLEIPATTIIATAMQLWHRTLTEERDRRVAELGDKEVNERQAYRGHITRELSQQIQTELSTRRQINSGNEEDG